MSTLRADAIARPDGLGPVRLLKHETAKATIHFSMNTASITDSTNITSITDLGTGDFGRAFTNPFDDDTFTVVGAASGTNTTAADQTYKPYLRTTATVQNSTSQNGTNTDMPRVMAADFGDIA